MTGTEKSAKPDVVKVGPHGYIHGWIKVGPGEAVPSHGHAAQTDDQGITHAYHDGKKIGVVVPWQNGESFRAIPMNDMSKSVDSMAAALWHVSATAGIQPPETAEGHSNPAHQPVSDYVPDLRPGEASARLTRRDDGSNVEHFYNAAGKITRTRVTS